MDGMAAWRQWSKQEVHPIGHSRANLTSGSIATSGQRNWWIVATIHEDVDYVIGIVWPRVIEGRRLYAVTGLQHISQTLDGLTVNGTHFSFLEPTSGKRPLALPLTERKAPNDY
jgi:hypothetical protein